MIDRKPALIARCTQRRRRRRRRQPRPRAEHLPLSVYGGGHGVTGSAVVDAGICIDLRGMNARRRRSRTSAVATPRAGATWGEFDAATQEHGLAVTGGRVSDTGIGGLALGSGSGWLERKFGFTCDNLVKAEVVTADGRQVVASEDENPDLFWGLRGGGGNFGIVTAFHLRLHPIGPIVLGGMLMYPAPMAGDLLALLPRLHRRRARRGRRRRRVHHRAARGVRARAGARPARRRRRRPATPATRPRARKSLAAAARVRPSGPRHGRSRCRTSRCSSCIDAPQPEGPATTTGPPTSTPSCPDEAIDIFVQHAHQAGVAAQPDPRHARRRRDQPGRRGRHGVRPAQRAVEHPLPVDVGRPGRHRAEHRVHARRRRRDEAVDHRPRST